MTDQNQRLGKCWKLFCATLIQVGPLHYQNRDLKKIHSCSKDLHCLKINKPKYALLSGRVCEMPLDRVTPHENPLRNCTSYMCNRGICRLVSRQLYLKHQYVNHQELSHITLSQSQLTRDPARPVCVQSPAVYLLGMHCLLCVTACVIMLQPQFPVMATFL